jgi:hypothetical protein
MTEYATPPSLQLRLFESPLAGDLHDRLELIWQDWVDAAPTFQRRFHRKVIMLQSLEGLTEREARRRVLTDG